MNSKFLTLIIAVVALILAGYTLMEVRSMSEGREEVAAAVQKLETMTGDHSSALESLQKTVDDASAKLDAGLEDIKTRVGSLEKGGSAQPAAAEPAATEPAATQPADQSETSTTE